MTLTDRAADLLIARHPHVAGGSRDNYTAIPCCADFSLFDPARVGARRSRAGGGTRHSRRRHVLLYLGSLGADYLLTHMIALFRALRARSAGALFLFSQ